MAGNDASEPAQAESYAGKDGKMGTYKVQKRGADIYAPPDASEPDSGSVGSDVPVSAETPLPDHADDEGDDGDGFAAREPDMEETNDSAVGDSSGGDSEAKISEAERSETEDPVAEGLDGAGSASDDEAQDGEADGSGRSDSETVRPVADDTGGDDVRSEVPERGDSVARDSDGDQEQAAAGIEERLIDPLHACLVDEGSADSSVSVATDEESPGEARQADVSGGGPQLTLRAALVLAPLVIVALLGALIAVWSIDSVVHANRVQRNVALAGHAVGGMSEDSLQAVVAEAVDGVGERAVTVVVDGAPVDDEVTAAGIGLALDEEAAVDAAMDAGRGSLLSRPFSWLGSLFSDHTVTPEYLVDEADLASTLGRLYTEGIDARNPRIELGGGEFTLVPGQLGTGLDLGRAAEDLMAAARSTSDPFGEVVLDIETSELAPSITDEQAQALADEANTLTESGLTIVVGDVEKSVSAEQLRSWITPIVDPADAVAVEGINPEDVNDLELSLHSDAAAADAAVRELFAEIAEEPTNATVTLSGDKIEIIDSQPGVACCKGDVGEQMWEALNDGKLTLEVDTEVVEPEYTTEDVEAWGIIEPVGGSRGWRAGAEVEGPRPGYTTWEVGVGGRAHNIETMASEIDGAVIPPGESWSINDHVGVRECPPYQSGGAIVDGTLATVCGGGTSQIATTLLNAAYFAGLDVTGQAHSQYFSRYPRGREATMGAPGTSLDVRIDNTTPHGIYIQGARHGDEVTFTIWSTEHIEVKDLGTTGVGSCVTVTNTRERTFPDGSVETDAFTAFYRPGSGLDC